jgi:hypothetical protein
MSDGLVRRCSKCLRFYPADSFPWKDKGRGYRRSRCRACTNSVGGIWRALNSDYGKRWREAHPDYMRSYARKRRAADQSTTTKEPECEPESIAVTKSSTAQ